MEEHIKHGLLPEQWVCTLFELSANIRDPRSGAAARLHWSEGQEGSLAFAAFAVFQHLLIRALPPPPPPGLRDLFSQRCLAAVTKERIMEESIPKLVNIRPLSSIALIHGAWSTSEPNWLWSYLHINIRCFIKLIKYLPSGYFFVFPIIFFFQLPLSSSR